MTLRIAAFAVMSALGGTVGVAGAETAHKAQTQVQVVTVTGEAVPSRLSDNGRAVENPDRIPWREAGYTIKQAIWARGGVPWGYRSISLQRGAETTTMTVPEINKNPAFMNTRLQPGDIVTVSHRPIRNWKLRNHQ